MTTDPKAPRVEQPKHSPAATVYHDDCFTRIEVLVGGLVYLWQEDGDGSSVSQITTSRECFERICRDHMPRPCVDSELDARCTQIADRIVPEYRSGGKSYSCGGTVAKRWQAAWDAACVAFGGDPARYRGSAPPD